MAETSNADDHRQRAEANSPRRTRGTSSKRRTRIYAADSGRPRQSDGSLLFDEEAEIRAIVIIAKAIRPLSLKSRTRALGWFLPAGSLDSGEAGRPKEEAKFEDLPALFEAARPKTDVDRALAACYYHNVIRSEADVDARTVLNDLRQMGHNLHNLYTDLRELNVKTPSLVMITSRPHARHKRYRITSAGSKHIRELMVRQGAER
jgi:hypothetical protein